MSIAVTPSALIRQTKTWEQWYANHYPRVRAASLVSLGNLADAEEVAQETLMHFWKSLLEGKVPRDAEEGSKLLMTICKNKTVDRLRRRQLRSCSHIDAIAESPEGGNALRANQTSPSRAAMNAEALKLVQETIDRVKSPGQQKVLSLFLIEGLSVVEIANHLKMTEGAVWSSLHRARQALQNLQAYFSH